MSYRDISEARKLGRIVYAGHGHEATMGYAFRARIESRTQTVGWRKKNKREVTLYWWVPERYFMAWENCAPWASSTYDTRFKAEAAAQRWLDRKEESPDTDSYVK